MVSADSVLDLGDADFDSKLADIDTALVMFYGPWCGHCKRLKPEFEKSSGDLLANDPPVSLVKVDCTEAGKDTCGRFEVRGYPSLQRKMLSSLLSVLLTPPSSRPLLRPPPS